MVDIKNCWLSTSIFSTEISALIFFKFCNVSSILRLDSTPFSETFWLKSNRLSSEKIFKSINFFPKISFRLQTNNFSKYLFTKTSSPDSGVVNEIATGINS